jgi:hypothetical protein
MHDDDDENGKRTQIFIMCLKTHARVEGRRFLTQNKSN